MIAERLVILQSLAAILMEPRETFAALGVTPERADRIDRLGNTWVELILAEDSKPEGLRRGALAILAELIELRASDLEAGGLERLVRRITSTSTTN